MALGLESLYHRNSEKQCISVLLIVIEFSTQWHEDKRKLLIFMS